MNPFEINGAFFIKRDIIYPNIKKYKIGLTLDDALVSLYAKGIIRKYFVAKFHKLKEAYCLTKFFSDRNAALLFISFSTLTALFL